MHHDWQFGFNASDFCCWQTWFQGSANTEQYLETLSLLAAALKASSFGALGLATGRQHIGIA